MKRFSPKAALVATGALILVLDAVILVVPRALADPPTASPTVGASVEATILAQASPTLLVDYGAATNSVKVGTPTFQPALATPSPTPSPKPKATPVPYRDTVWNARTYVKNRIGAKGYDCINAVWTAESRWNPLAGNASGAYGIPQAKPGSKMATFGSNWRTSPLTQVKWGLWYVTNRYHGSACEAYDFWQAHGWY